MKRKTKINFICPYPYGEVASQRFRFELYFGILKEEGVRWRHLPFYSGWVYRNLYRRRRYLIKIAGTVYGFVKRIAHLMVSIPADYVFIHREAAPLGPPILEWMLSKLLRKRIIYDLDDAIWLENTTRENLIISGMKWHKKVFQIARWSYKVSCCNSFLAVNLEKYNPDVQIIPTTVDTSKFCRPSPGNPHKKVAIGWTGTHSTLDYLTPLLNVIRSVIQKNPHVVFRIICNKSPSWEFPNMEYLDWQKETEVSDLAEIDIGIMPLPESQWAKGKCGFKIIQYFSMGIPAVATDHGYNKELIRQGENGYLCKNDSEWLHCLNLLVGSATLREQLGNAGRDLIEKSYSSEANRTNFLSLFE